MNKKKINKESGMALIFALLLATIIVGMLAIGAQLVLTSLKESHKLKAIYAQGEAIAKAGVSDSLSWFRRQQRQPVCSGYPVVSGTYPDSAFCPIEDTDTIDQSIGIVQEEMLTFVPPIYARYEVKRQNTNNYLDDSLTDTEAVHDITGEKIQGAYNGQGLVWHIESHGYIYAKRDGSKRFDEAPNQVLGRAVISTEFRRISIIMPSTKAAVYVDTGGTWSSKYLHVHNGAKIKGGTGFYGVVFKKNSSSTNYDITGTPAGYISNSLLMYGVTAGNTPVFDAEYIFGVSASELKLMSDYLVTDVSKLPYSGATKDLPSIGIYYIDGNATFNDAWPLRRTSGILFVNGNLTIESHSDGGYFTGVIYVNNGSVTINGPFLISGALICNNKGRQLIQVTGPGTTEINYDDDIINYVRQQLTQYRENKAMYRVHSVLK